MWVVIFNPAHPQLAKFVRENHMYEKAVITEVVTKVAENIRWLERYHRPISRWLTRHFPFDRIHAIIPTTASPRKSARIPRKYSIKLVDTPEEAYEV